jgi:hypothetical protein
MRVDQRRAPSQSQERGGVGGGLSSVGLRPGLPRAHDTQMYIHIYATAFGFARPLRNHLTLEMAVLEMVEEADQQPDWP